tara:strand:+ start:2019 stop:2240 length:222 start_codon:yes stop_codon:yes gene_type:complete
MIQGAVAKYALSKVLEYLFNKSKRFKKVLDYVHKENDADLRINDLESEQAILKARLDHVILELKKLNEKRPKS